MAASASGLLSLLVVLLPISEVQASPTLRIAVAPFAGEKEALSIAKVLADELARRDIERLIAPGDFVAENTFDPRAADVRRWAYNSAVDAIVVGRVYSVGKNDDRTRIVETVVRSGHSGAELSRHEVSLNNDRDLQRSVENLALSILVGMGYEATPGDAGADAGAEAASGPTTDPAAAQGAEGHSPGRGLDANFSESGFRNDAPIEIKADEAEIINREEGRRLIFQRNVLVKQANVSLRSDRLEAIYLKGESQPRELLAEGRVAIDQGDRHAKCDRAVYLREAHLLTCDGHAELVQGCDIVRGESIEFDLNGDQARVEGAASIVIQPEGDVQSICTPDRGKL